MGRTPPPQGLWVSALGAAVIVWTFACIALQAVQLKHWVDGTNNGQFANISMATVWRKDNGKDFC